jgi:hypothetical protein
LFSATNNDEGIVDKPIHRSAAGDVLVQASSNKAARHEALSLGEASNVTTKGRSFTAEIDRRWPHQVALSGEVARKRVADIHAFCKPLHSRHASAAEVFTGSSGARAAPEGKGERRNRRRLDALGPARLNEIIGDLGGLKRARCAALISGTFAAALYFACFSGDTA